MGLTKDDVMSILENFGFEGSLYEHWNLTIEDLIEKKILTQDAKYWANPY